jgi:hypothetical protein
MPKTKRQFPLPNNLFTTPMTEEEWGDRPMWQCPHREFLLYFDRVHGLQSVWCVCDFCKIRFSFEVLETPAWDPTNDLYYERGS